MKSRYRIPVYLWIILISLLQTPATGTSAFAQDVSMDAFQKRFEQETGKSWETATAEEKRNFVRQHSETSAKTPERHDTAPVKRTERTLVPGASLAIRTAFKRKTGKDWDEATVEEQKNFRGKFRAQEQKEKQNKERNLQKKIAARQKAEQQRAREIQKREKAKQMAEAERQRKIRQAARERDSARKKLDSALKQMGKTRH